MKEEFINLEKKELPKGAFLCGSDEIQSSYSVLSFEMIKYSEKRIEPCWREYQIARITKNKIQIKHYYYHTLYLSKLDDKQNKIMYVCKK